MSPHPTESGPFQKYLFSGTCYVSLGECHTHLVELHRRPVSLSERAELQTRLTDLWQQIFEQHLVVAETVPGGPQRTEPPGLNPVLGAWHAQVQNRVGESMRSLVEAFLSDPQRPPDFPSFFQAWATVCDRDWQHLMHTEALSEIIGQVVNNGIILATTETAK